MESHSWKVTKSPADHTLVVELSVNASVTSPAGWLDPPALKLTLAPPVRVATLGDPNASAAGADATAWLVATAADATNAQLAVRTEMRMTTPFVAATWFGRD